MKDKKKLNLEVKNFYKIIGVDILVKKDFNPLLLEMNYLPGVYFRNNIDKEVKINLFFDALNIIGIAPYSRKSQKPLNIIKEGKEIEDNINNAYCELERPRGSFELIFPTKENIKDYTKYCETISPENNIFWKKIRRK